LNRGSPASAAGNCSWPNIGARGIRSAGVTTAATSCAVTCERQWPLWHGSCCSGVSGAGPRSTFVARAVVLVLKTPRSHPAQWINETSRPTVSNTTNGSRRSRLPVVASDMVTVTCIIVLSVDARQRAFQCPLYQTTWLGARTQGEKIGLHLHVLDAAWPGSRSVASLRAKRRSRPAGSTAGTRRFRGHARTRRSATPPDPLSPRSFR